MRLNVRITPSTNVLRAKIASLGAKLKELGPAYLRGSIVLLTSAQQRIRDDGPGWPPTVEQEKGSPLYRTGALFRSLQIGGDGNVQELLPNGIRVGSNLKTPDGQYSIAYLMQHGTGPIVPKNGSGLLVFEVNGQKVFSRGTKGIPARPFLYITQEDATKVAGVFSSYIMGRQV